jgi:hypothetical protein
MSDTENKNNKQSKRNLLRQAKERENAAKIAAKNRETLEKNKLNDPAYLTAKAKQQRNDDITRIMTIFNTYENTRKMIPKLDLKFIVNSSEKYKYPLMREILKCFNDVVNRLNISYINSYAEKRINLFLKNFQANKTKDDSDVILLPASNPLYKVGLVNLLVRIKKNIVTFTDNTVKQSTIDAPVESNECLKELVNSYIWNLKINDCDNFTLLTNEEQQDKFSRALFRICKIVNNPIPDLQAAENKLQNDANAQINKEAIAAQNDATNGIPQKSILGKGENFSNTKDGLILDPEYLRVAGIIRSYNLTPKDGITNENIQVIIDYAEKKNLPLNTYVLKILNDDKNKFKINVWIGYITPKLTGFLNSQKLLPAIDDPLYQVEFLNNSIKIKQGIQTYKTSEVTKGSNNTILDFKNLQQLAIGYINDVKINTCAVFNLKGIDQQKELYTHELFRTCTIAGVPIKSIDLADRNLNIIDVLKKKVKKSNPKPEVVKTEGFMNIKTDNYNIEYVKFYLQILIFILIFFYICRI